MDYPYPVQETYQHIVPPEDKDEDDDELRRWCVRIQQQEEYVKNKPVGHLFWEQTEVTGTYGLQARWALRKVLPTGHTDPVAILDRTKDYWIIWSHHARILGESDNTYPVLEMTEAVAKDVALAIYQLTKE